MEKDDISVEHIKEIIGAMANKYNAVYLIDLNLNMMEPIMLNNRVALSVKSSFRTYVSYRSVYEDFTNKFVVPDEREAFMEAASIEKIKNELVESSMYFHIFHRYNTSNQLEVVEMEVIRIGDSDEFSKAIMTYRTITKDLIEYTTRKSNSFEMARKRFSM